jgi:NAD(P)-dependent dehydrogenase (short-subunit alcohol dehydrogenase family)
MLTEGKFWYKMIEKTPTLVSDFLENHVSNKRFGLYEEIAPFVLLLCSDHASYCSGTEINIDGGWK